MVYTCFPPFFPEKSKIINQKCLKLEMKNEKVYIKMSPMRKKNLCLGNITDLGILIFLHPQTCSYFSLKNNIFFTLSRFWFPRCYAFFFSSFLLLLFRDFNCNYVMLRFTRACHLVKNPLFMFFFFS